MRHLRGYERHAHVGDAGEMQGRFRGDAGEMQGRYRGDLGRLRGEERHAHGVTAPLALVPEALGHG